MADQAQSTTAATAAPSAADAAAAELVAASPAPEGSSPPAKGAAAEAPKADPKPPVSDSTRFAALSRKEKALMKREADVEARIAELEGKFKPWQEVSELASSNKYEAMRKLGFREEDIRALGITPDTVDPIQAAEARARQVVEERLSKDARERTDAQAKQYEAAKQKMQEQAERLLESDPSLELLKANDSAPAVVALIEQQYHTTGEVLPVAEAAKRIEKSIEDKVNALIAASPRLQKALSERFTPKPVEQAAGTAKSKPTPSLTHAASSAPPKPGSRLTSAERLARAIKIANGQPL